MEIKTYNKKGFLLPDSIRSASIYHAKIMPDGRYMFRIHDCNSGIRLVGDLNNPEEVNEAVEKLEALEKAANEFRVFIKNHFDGREYKN